MSEKPEDYDKIVAEMKSSAEKEFADFDTNGDQKIDFEEFYAFAYECADEASKPSREDMKVLFDKNDKNGSGGIDIAEYIAFKAKLETGYDPEE